MLPSACVTEMSSGVPMMDQLHHDVFEALERVSHSTDQAFGNEYRIFVTKMEYAFRQEDQWMEEIDLPASNLHQEQHARVLGALHNVHSRVMDGELRLGREVVDHLFPQWFEFHISTVDMALALAMQLAQTGTTPAPIFSASPETSTTPL
jgi:hemerythrin